MGREVIPMASGQEVEFMENVLAAGDVKHKYAVRIQAVLSRARKQSTNETAAILGIVSESRYVRRFNEGGADALLRDKTRKPGKTPIAVEVKYELSRIVCSVKPEDATHWSTRELAKDARDIVGLEPGQ